MVQNDQEGYYVAKVKILDDEEEDLQVLLPNL